jgi:acetolactate synthase I/II/III large subunit
MNGAVKLSDYVAGRLAGWGVRHVFLVPGGGAMHLNDSIGRAPGLRYICTHHEQAAAMAAECYARVTGGTGVVNVTSGPGSINALNGVFGAWTDSVPMLVLSGQVKRETCMAVTGATHLRQLGDQEVDIVRMAGGVTKYAVLVDDPASIRYHLEKAWFLASSGRPGPCWIDIPVDVQSALIDAASLSSYDPVADTAQWDRLQVSEQCRAVIERLSSASRPVVMAGTGVRAAGALEEFREVIRRLGIPVTTAWTHDLIASDDPLFCGRPGTIGDRAGNFTVQGSDALLVLGSRLNIRQVSYNWPSFARQAFKMQVDVDAAELAKPTVRPDLPIHCDLKVFLQEMLRQLSGVPYRASRHAAWLAQSRERVQRYPVVLDKFRQGGSPLSPYYFVEELFAALADDEVVVCGNAAACIVPLPGRAFKVGPAVDFEFRRGIHGIRPSSRHGRCGRARGPPRDLPGGRRKPSIQHSGAADHRSPSLAGEDLCPGQRRLPFHPSNTGQLLRTPGGRKSVQRDLFPGHGEAGAGVRAARHLHRKRP